MGSVPGDVQKALIATGRENERMRERLYKDIVAIAVTTYGQTSAAEAVLDVIIMSIYAWGRDLAPKAERELHSFIESWKDDLGIDPEVGHDLRFSNPEDRDE